MQCIHCCDVSANTFASVLQQMSVMQNLVCSPRFKHIPSLLQGVFTSLYGGVGGGLGGLLGGFVYSTYGAAAVFQVGLIVISVGWVLCTVCQAVATCVCRTPTEDQREFDA